MTNNKEFDLCRRTTLFSKEIIDFVRVIPLNIMTKPILSQLIRSGTSVGANYHEADECNSKKDFVNKINIAKKEAKETKYWLEIISHTYPYCREDARLLWKEAQELTLIFSKSISTSRKR